MRRTLLIGLAFATTLAAQAASAYPGVSLSVPHDDLVTIVDRGGKWGLTCRGPDVYLSMGAYPYPRGVSTTEAGWWFMHSPVHLLTVDGIGVPFWVDSAQQYWNGWYLRLKYDPDAESAGWLERLQNASEIIFATPNGLAPFYGDTSDFAEFVRQCEDERFGLYTDDPDDTTTLHAPLPEGLERAAIYELPHRSLDMPTIPATVSWRLEASASGMAVVAAISAPSAGVEAELTIARSEDNPSWIDFRTHVTVGPDHPGFQHFIWIRAFANEVGGREAGLDIDPFNFSGEVAPDTWLMRIGLSELQEILTYELVELGTGLKNATYDLITIEIGETGRAVFAEAMAAWGIEPATE